ncbi:MAG: hypothetical protein KAY06_09585, partial [Aeromonadaceae bacterium]|nr:hypothetical protein [Aeromonadaceae bacterium]
ASTTLLTRPLASAINSSSFMTTGFLVFGYSLRSRFAIFMPASGSEPMERLSLVRLVVRGAWLWGKGDKGGDKLQTKPRSERGFGVKSDKVQGDSKGIGRMERELLLTGRA